MQSATLLSSTSATQTHLRPTSRMVVFHSVVVCLLHMQFGLHANLIRTNDKPPDFSGGLFIVVHRSLRVTEYDLGDSYEHTVAGVRLELTSGRPMKSAGIHIPYPLIGRVGNCTPYFC